MTVYAERAATGKRRYGTMLVLAATLLGTLTLAACDAPSDSDCQQYVRDNILGSSKTYQQLFDSCKGN